jgi:hypothetical protein
LRAFVAICFLLAEVVAPRPGRQGTCAARIELQMRALGAPPSWPSLPGGKASTCLIARAFQNRETHERDQRTPRGFLSEEAQMATHAVP